MILSQSKALVRRHTEVGILLVCLVLVVVFTLYSGDRWANYYNFASIAQVSATLGIMALGASLVMVTGEIDVSVGSIFGFSALTYLGMAPELGFVPAAILAMIAGAAIGALNGFLVTHFKAPSLIITLSTLMVFRGLTIALNEGFSFAIPYKERSVLDYQMLGGGDLLGLNTGVWWMLLIMLVLIVFMYMTPQGNRLLALGGSAASARSRGIRVNRYKIMAFMLCGLLAGIAGILDAGKIGVADSGMGQYMEMKAIAACVLGGTALAGGRISLVGVIAGAFALSSIQSFLIVNGIKTTWFQLLLGIIVVAAAVGDRALRDWALRGK
ncbi:ribose ABC transporter [Marinobacterium aestuarii]|uniref:Ribose ABC transporter n=1 Tax=Marinobacterium aestuarii TaxID=1821621 RepID=A0A1A9EVQ1_9GAMM|nr:ABC transporter permease [Marinobacterium aestuarii]ANG61593.1 ribose ABC transporter [Marinobacterium aestuarii]